MTTCTLDDRIQGQRLNDRIQGQRLNLLTVYSFQFTSRLPSFRYGEEKRMCIRNSLPDHLRFITRDWHLSQCWKQFHTV